MGEVQLDLSILAGERCDRPREDTEFEKEPMNVDGLLGTVK